MVAVGIWAALIGGRALIALARGLRHDHGPWPRWPGWPMAAFPWWRSALHSRWWRSGSRSPLRVRAPLVLGGAVIGLFAIFHGLCPWRRIAGCNGCARLYCGFSRSPRRCSTRFGLALGFLIGRSPRDMELRAWPGPGSRRSGWCCSAPPLAEEAGGNLAEKCMIR